MIQFYTTCNLLTFCFPDASITVCDRDAFTCNISADSECISEKRVCDGKQDCGNGEDEDAVMCKCK